MFLAAFPLFIPTSPAASASANDASPPDRSTCLVDANNAFPLDGATCFVDANAVDSPFPFFSRRRRPAFLCELAGISAEPLNWESDANRETLFYVAETFPTTRSLHFADVASPLATAPISPPSQLALSSAIPATRETQTASIVRGAYLSNLPIAPFRGRIFAYVDGSWGRQDEQNESPFASGFDVASFGGGVGQDWRLSKNAIWGLGFQGRGIQIAPASSIYESEIDSLAGFLRLSLFGPLWRLDLSIGAAKHWNGQSESIFDVLKYSSTQWNYEAEFGVRFDKGYTRVEPLVNVRVMTLQEPSDAERRLVLLGRPSDYSDASYRLKLGSRFSWEYATRLATLKPFLTATWNHEFGDRALYVSGENTPFPIVYRYAKHRMARDRLDLGGGVDAALRDTVDVFFHYDVEFAKEYANYLFYAGFHKKF
ncbi:MAG: autotransporter outer membrane beta-barrel domain-containing protein [Thermoguttaceae bacterium]|nr:autotransporter outer membrane beta-barrel domain-containing protein [Thermoguttaceae bacterium]